ncbi:MAG: GyrI-like domain-containing protein [Thermoplasmatota archaeon]|nr:GyrI-like domain-containing protein [Halobacteriales archaeon]
MQHPEVRIERLPERTVAVVPHAGPVERIDDTRRPLYRHMIMHELVGGPSIVRFLDRPQGEHAVDALVTTHFGFEGDHVVTVEQLPAGRYAILHYEGPPEGLAAARAGLRDWMQRHGHHAAGPLLQVHHMDPVEGILEEQLQVLLG